MNGLANRQPESWLAGGGIFCLLLLCITLFGCAGFYLDPGANPARIRVMLKASAGDYEVPRPNNGVGELNWQWGLFMVTEKGDLTPLKPESGERLHAIMEKDLIRDTVFLVPAGHREIRLLVEGYVGVHLGKDSGFIHTVAFLSEDFSLDLAGGKEVVIRRSISQ